MSKLFEETVRESDSTEEYLLKAFKKSEYEIEDIEEENITVQNAQAPAQLIARVNGCVRDDEGERVIDGSEIYARLLLDEKDDGVVVWVQDTTS